MKNKRRSCTIFNFIKTSEHFNVTKDADRIIEDAYSIILSLRVFFARAPILHDLD